MNKKKSEEMKRYPGAAEIFNSIPEELRQLNNWVLWKKVPDIDKKTKKQRMKPDGSPQWKKVPYQTNGKWAKSNTPETWTTFDIALDTFQSNPNKYNGLGIQFGGGSGLIGIDFDGIPDEVQRIRSGDFTGEIGGIIQQLGSYTEISQSGTGIHIIGRGSLPGADFKTSVAEFYANNRYFAMTGDIIPGYDTVENITEAVQDIYHHYNPKSRKAPREVTRGTQRSKADEPHQVDLSEQEPSPLSDDEVIEKASSASNGQKFKDLFYSGPGSDHSASDLALCNILAFYTRKDPGAIDRIFRQSALYRPDKWNTIHDPENNRTYGQMTIDRAIAGTTEVYGKRPQRRSAAGEKIPYFESGNMYWKEVKKSNGEETAVPISNFILQPVREVEILETGQVITECQAVNVYSETKDVQILPADFNTTMKFNDAVDSKGMRFNGSLTDLQFIKSLMANHLVPKVVGTQTNGFHTVDDRRLYIDSAGIVGGDADSIVSMATSPFESSISQEEPITRDELLEILPKLLNFNTMANTTSIVGWSCATYVKDLFKENKVKFPHLFISGTAGSGKSETLSHVLSPLLGINNSPINANDNTKYALGIISNASNHIPILIEEYKPRKMDKWKVQGISDIMRNTYDSHVSVRGMPSTRGKTEVLTLQAPLVICGEEMTEEKANLERTIFCTFGREDSRKHVDNFQNLKQRTPLLRKLGRSLLNLALKISSDDLMSYYRKADSLDGMNFLKSSRTRSNVAVTICGLYLLNDVIKSLGINFNIEDDALEIIANAEREEKDNGGTLNDVDETLNTMSHICGLLPEKVSRAMCDPIYIDENGDLLYLRVKEIYSASSKYLKDNGLENTLMSLTQFSKLIQKESIFDSNRKVINTRHNGIHKSQKALTLKIPDMEGRNIDLSGFTRADQFYKDHLPEDSQMR